MTNLNVTASVGPARATFDARHADRNVAAGFPTSDGAKPNRPKSVPEHRRVVAHADRLLAILKAPHPDRETLVDARWAFASALLKHLAEKERHVYAKLEAGTGDVARMGEGSKADLLARFDRYVAHVEAWPTSRALSGWPSYRADAIAVVEAFVARLNWEETDLVGFLVRHGIDVSKPCRATSNWVRKAFDLKSSVGSR